MIHIISNEIGGIHLVASVIALIAGTVILAIRKGTRKHKSWGYVYVGSMVTLLVTSFMLYELFDGFGVFHVASIISSITLFMGMWPVVKRRGNWVVHHLAWMYWSVMGLYAAFASEVITRMLPTKFWYNIGLVVGVLMLMASVVFRRNIRQWENQFSNI